MLSLDSKIHCQEIPSQAPLPPTFTVWASFDSEPFLTRAGQIGLVERYPGTRANAEERCCQKVVEYLLNMVKEDYQLENEEMKQRWKIDNFAELQKRALKMDVDSV